MLTFLRTIRRSLIDSGATRKYLAYAVGEILLVMIGILLALQVSNWNEQRQTIKLERSILSSLKSEFYANRLLIKECLDEIIEVRAYADSIRLHLSPNPPTVSIQKVNDWFGEIGATNRCALSIDVLDDIRSSGKLNILSNEEIRRNIGKWSSFLKELENEEEDWEQEFSNVFYPYTYRWISWDDVDNLGNVDDKRFFNSRFENDPRIILRQFEFTNIMSVHYWRMRRIEERTDDLLFQSVTVLGLLEKELNN